MDKKKEILQKLQRFLKEEEEMFGPLAFTAPKTGCSDESAEIIPHEQEAIRDSDTDRSAADDTVSKKGDEAGAASLKKDGEADNTVPKKEEKADTANSKKEDKSAQQNSERSSLEQCTTLEELREYCDSLSALKTDLPDTNLVFGVGNPHADLMIIGEAPGEQEDREGEPFVGAAGQLLDKILSAIRFKREDVYIANILKHRPPGNRNPSPDEIERSLPVLYRQIDLTSPKVILCVGKVPGTTLLNNDTSLSRLRGRFYPFRNAQLTVTYHPAALLRNPKWKRPVWEDVQKVRQKYDELDGKP